jgi:hypothetical protein
MEQHVMSAPQSAEILPHLHRLLTYVTVPSAKEFLLVGVELHEAILRHLISGTIPDRHSHQSCAGNLLTTATRHQLIESHTRDADMAQIQVLLDELKDNGQWPLVRRELVKFASQRRVQVFFGPGPARTYGC